MGIDTSAETVIHRSRDQVAAFAIAPVNDPRWIGGIQHARQLDDGPITVGTRVEREASFLGRRIEYVNEVVELERAIRLHMRSVKAPFPMQVTYEFADAAGEGTRMRIRVQGDAGRLYRVAAPLLSLAVRRSISRDLRRFRVCSRRGSARVRRTPPARRIDRRPPGMRRRPGLIAGP